MYIYIQTKIHVFDEIEPKDISSRYNIYNIILVEYIESLKF